MAYRVLRIRRIVAGFIGLIRSGWWVPVLTLSLLAGLAPLSLSTSSPPIGLNELSSRNLGLTKAGGATYFNVLNVPFAGQGATRWCFEASLSMVLRYYGAPVTPEDVAGGMGVGPKDSTGFADIFLGPLESYLARWTGLSSSQHIGNWGFSHYTQLIDAGVPVIVSTFGLPGHTVVVTGYAEVDGERYLYVNDPSGYYSRRAWGADRNHEARVSWSQFSRRLWSELVIAKKPDDGDN